jgi:oligopeptide transport system permease protein
MIEWSEKMNNSEENTKNEQEKTQSEDTKVESNSTPKEAGEVLNVFETEKKLPWYTKIWYGFLSVVRSSQTKYVVKRLLLALLTTFIILSVTYILIKLLPYSLPIGNNDSKYSYFENEIRLGYVIKDTVSHPELKAITDFDYNGSHYFYYQVPVMKQYFRWLGNIVTAWDWGQSAVISKGLDATKIIGQKLPVSMLLNVISTIISVPLGIALGIWAALKKNKPTDAIISTLVMIFISIPSFILITFVMLIFCYNLGWFPTQWPGPSAPTSQKFLAYFVPVICLSFGSICGYCRFTRAELCEVMSSEYLLLARTKGLTRGQAIVRHALRNAMVPIVPSILAEFLSIMGGSMILENLYGIPGIGSLFVEAMSQSNPDYNVLFVDMAIFTTFGLAAGVLVDISYGFIDPRIRMGAKK